MAKLQSHRLIYDTILAPSFKQGKLVKEQALFKWLKDSLPWRVDLFGEPYMLSETIDTSFSILRDGAISVALSSAYHWYDLKRPDEMIIVSLHFTFTPRKTRVGIHIFNNTPENSPTHIRDKRDDLEITGIVKDDDVRKMIDKLFESNLRKLEKSTYYIPWIPLEYATGQRKTVKKWNSVFEKIYKRVPKYRIGGDIFNRPHQKVLKGQGYTPKRIMAKNIGIVRAFLKDPKSLDAIGKFTMTHLITGFNEDGTYRGLDIKHYRRWSYNPNNFQRRDELTGGLYQGSRTYPERILPLQPHLYDFWDVLTSLRRQESKLTKEHPYVQLLLNVCNKNGETGVVVPVGRTERADYGWTGFSVTFPSFYMRAKEAIPVPVHKYPKPSVRLTEFNRFDSFAWELVPVGRLGCDPVKKVTFDIKIRANKVNATVQVEGWTKREKSNHYDFPPIVVDLKEKFDIPIDKSIAPIAWIDMVYQKCTDRLNKMLDFSKKPRLIGGSPAWLLLKQEMLLKQSQRQLTQQQSRQEIPPLNPGEWKKILKIFLPGNAKLKVIKKSHWKHCVQVEMEDLHQWFLYLDGKDEICFGEYDIIRYDKRKAFREAIRQYLARKKK